MTDTEALRELRDHPFLRGLDPGFVEAMGSATRERTFATGEMVIREGDAAREFHLIVHGKIALELVAPDRPRLSLLSIGPGEIVGWSWLLPPHRWQVDGRALKPTRALSVDGPALVRLLEGRPKEGFDFLRRLLPVVTRRLEVARLQVLDIHGV